MGEEMNEQLNLFFGFLENDRKVSSNTLQSYKRDLKQFTNIDYSIDCKNSHPLLFNYFIFSNKDISIELSYLISSILYKINVSGRYINGYLKGFF